MNRGCKAFRLVGIGATMLGMILVGQTSGAEAQQVTLAKTAEPIPRAYPGRSLDILGIGSSTSSEDALAILAKNYPSDSESQRAGPTYNVTKVSMQYQYRDIQVSSQDFYNEATYANNTVKNVSDNIYVLFGTPSTGGGVVAVRRNVTYTNQAEPGFKALVAQLYAKYGKPSFSTVENPAEWAGQAPGAAIIWAFNDKTLLRCDGGPHLRFNPHCETALIDDQPDQLEKYERTVKSGFSLIVDVTILLDPADTSRVTSLEVTLDDEGNKAKTYREALKDISLTAKKLYDSESVGQKPQQPKL